MRVQFMTFKLGSYQTHGNLNFFSSVPLCLQLSHILLCALGHIPDSLLQDLGRQAKMSIELLGDREDTGCSQGPTSAVCSEAT